MRSDEIPAEIVEKMLSTRLPLNVTEACVLLAAVYPLITRRVLEEAATDLIVWSNELNDQDRTVPIHHHGVGGAVDRLRARAAALAAEDADGVRGGSNRAP